MRRDCLQRPYKIPVHIFVVLHAFRTYRTEDISFQTVLTHVLTLLRVSWALFVLALHNIAILCSANSNLQYYFLKRQCIFIFRLTAHRGLGF